MPVSDGTTVYIGSDSGRLVALDRRSGQEIWRYQAGGAIKESAAFNDQSVCFTTLNGDVVALDRLTGLQQWRVSLTERIDAGPLLLDDRVVVPCSDGSVSALSLADGQRLWRSSIGLGARLLSTPAGGASVYVETDGALIALDPATGEIAWRRELRGEFRWWPVTTGERVVTAGSGDAGGGLSVVAAASGEVLARYTYSGDNHWAVPAVDRQSGDIYAGIEGGVFRFDPALTVTGRWVGQAPALAGGKRYVMWQPIIGRHLVIVPGHLEITTADALFFFDREAGLNYLGRLTLPEKLSGQPLLVGGTLLCPTTSGHLLALAPTRVTVNDAAVDFGLDQPLQSERTGRVLVPVRPVIDALGGDVAWDAASQTATVTYGGHCVVLAIGSQVITVDGQTVAIDEPAQLIYGRTMLPIRAVIEGIGGEVGWDQIERTVLVRVEIGQ
jgi:outer membrane protein assembly factor BamB